MDITRILRLIEVFLILGIFSTGLCMDVNWFQAQSHCAGKKEMLTTDRNRSGKSYWTAGYQRKSQWIQLIGCFEETDVMHHAAVEITMEINSAGYCQEICVKSNMTIFAIKNSTCVCLRKWDTGSENNVSKCTFICPNNIDGKFTKECGGETAFNVFKSKNAFSCSNYLNQGDCVAIECTAESKYFCSSCTQIYHGLCQPGDSPNLVKNITYIDWENSMEICKEKHFGYLLGNLHLSNASKACTWIGKTKGGLAWIGAAKQQFEGIDLGYSINTGEREHFIKCETCEMGKGCSFVDCTRKNHRAVCSDINFSTVTYAPPSTTTTTTPPTTIRRLNTKETTIGTTEAKTTTTTRTQFTQSSTITVTGTIGTVNPFKNSTTAFLKKKAIGQEVSAIITPIIVIVVATILGGTGFICWRQRKAKKFKESVQEKPESYLNAHQIKNDHAHHDDNNVCNSSYFILEPKSPYEESGNGSPQTENPYIEAKEGEYDHLGNSNGRRKVTDIDDYGETTRHKSFHKETEEENYDHLENTPSRSKIVEDTYCHTCPNQMDSSSDYDVANHTEHKDTENTYDHAGAGLHLQNDSNYDYSELKR